MHRTPVRQELRKRRSCCRHVIELGVGQRVRIGEQGVSVFEVLEIEDEDHALIQSIEDVPGR